MSSCLSFRVVSVSVSLSLWAWCKPVLLWMYMYGPVGLQRDTIAPRSRSLSPSPLATPPLPPAFLAGSLKARRLTLSVRLRVGFPRPRTTPSPGNTRFYVLDLHQRESRSGLWVLEHGEYLGETREDTSVGSSARVPAGLRNAGGTEKLPRLRHHDRNVS